MLLILSVIFSLSFAEYKIGDFTIDESLAVFGGFDTNPLYREAIENMGTLFRLEPDVGLSYDVNELAFRGGAGFEYEKYFRYGNQSNFAWDLETQIRVKPD
ncbi:MAG: hypothetical protein JXA66_00115, partial [Oligoflexia bacterium]|nr:hypothetical protein [Oligoflexia bacterium]